METTRARILCLPNELLLSIISHTITPTTIAPDVILRGSNGRHQFPEECDVMNLRRACRRFRDLVNRLLSRPNSTTVILMRGPIPLGSKRKMATLFANYTSILGKVLPRPPDDSNPHNVVVHFQPDFSGTLASVNWDRESSLDPIFKDPTTARMSLKGHYAAAIMLGAILHEIVGKTPGVRTRLVFREAHGTSLYKECSMMETSSPVARDFLPFWELDAMCTILYHWRWLRTVNPLWGQSIKNYFTLPQIAHATKTAWDSEKVYAHCSQKLRRAWEVEKRGAMVLKTGATHSILGYHEKVWLVPRDDPFPHWLTTISLYMVDVRCFSVQVDFLPRLEHNENRAVELVL